MYSYKIDFFSLNNVISFIVKFPEKVDIERFIGDLLSFFGHADEGNQKYIVESLQQNSQQTQNNISKFVDGYKAQMPEMNAIAAFFRKLKKDEYFLFLPNLEFDTYQSLQFIDQLRAKTEGRDFEEVKKENSQLFEYILTKYKMNTFGGNRICIGERNKNTRVCRFCQNTKKPTRFESEAHGISEALGNKTIILYEECDQCNDDFSTTIEPDIIQYLALFRTFFDVKGKGGSKKFKGRNFELKNEDGVMLTFNSFKDKPKDNSLPFELKLEANENISLQNIYKSLCKYFLSVIESDDLVNFSETIKWVNGDRLAVDLPLIGEMISYSTFTKQPKLITYIRKVDDKSIPFAIAEFHFTCKVFVYIIPFSSKDDSDFINQNDFDNYWKIFQNFKKSSAWIFTDYSDDTKKKITFKLSADKSNKV